MLLLKVFFLVCLLLGILFLLGKKILEKAEGAMNKSVGPTREFGYKYNVAVGVFLIVFSAVLFYISLTLRR